MNNMRIESAQFRAEFNAQSFHGGAPAVSHPQPSPSHTSGINGYGNGHYERPRTQPEPHQPAMYSQRPTELPPLRGINGPAVPEAMSGVQYQQHDPRANGYRAGVERF